ncbi:hypothetical protein BGZ94_009315 [Podila epigama]|nr:hypothetical protein BGZ94_009315 [Podila epigama]
MSAQTQAHGTAASSAQPIVTSVQVALRIRPIVTDTKSASRIRTKAETEVLSLVERSSFSHNSSSDSSAPSPTPGQNDAPQQIVVVPLQRHFTFDQVFGTHATQEDVYQGSVKRMVDKFMEGYNVTIMAYGQTSSGKTYTMGTGAPSTEDRGSPSEGIIPRAMHQLFREARRPPVQNYPGFRVPGHKMMFRVSFVEIYNEDLIDLLAKSDVRVPVTIREDAKGNIFWTGVQEVVVASVEEVIQLLWYGSQNRQTHSTEMNEKSSRSHAIFSITLRQEKFVPAHPPPEPLSSSEGRSSPTFRRSHTKSPSLTGYPTSGTLTSSGSSASLASSTSNTTSSSIPTPFTSGIVAPGSKLKRQSVMSESPAQTPNEPELEGEWITLTSKFHFVDLAGSERLKRTSAIGDRAKEGISINAGLHALGNVISALGDPSKKASHVPYRDSKLTRLLQDSLGGNALALMIACVSPSEVNLGETLNTLKYANRARNIKNSSSLNQEINMDNPEYLRSIIQKLKMEIKLLKEGGATRQALTVNTESAVAAEKASPSSRLSTGSTTSTIVPHDSLDDRFSSSPSPSPSPSIPRRLSHYQSRDSISTDISHAYLNSVQEEENDDQYSESSSSGRTTIGRSTIPSLMLPSVDSKSFQDFVEPVIEEYEKVISGLETHLAMTQAALNHSEQMLEEQQGRIDVIEQERSMLLSRKQQRSTPSPPPAAAALEELQKHKELQAELESTLKNVQTQLEQAEARKVESEKYISELETKLAQEQVAAQDQIQALLKEREEEEEQKRAIADAVASSKAHEQHVQAEKEQELKVLSEMIVALEEKCSTYQRSVEAEADDLRKAQDARSLSAKSETEIEKEDRDAQEAQREEALIEKLQIKAALEQELESTRARHEQLLAELEEVSIKTPRVRTDSALEEDGPCKVLTGDKDVEGLAITNVQAASASTSLLEEELAKARESESQLRQETVELKEKLEGLQKDHKASLDLEEMLHLAVADLENRLKAVQASESKHQADLEESLARIHDLEERSTKAEKEALEKVEELKVKLSEAKATADERHADELLELLEKMEKERSKVEELQTLVENQLLELAAERTRVSELESERDTDKARIETLEKDIETQKLQVQEKAARVAALESSLAEHETMVTAKTQLEKELDELTFARDEAMDSKAKAIEELEAKIVSLEKTLAESTESTNARIETVRAELDAAQAELAQSQAQVRDQEQELRDLREKVGALEQDAQKTREAIESKDAEHSEALNSLQRQLKMAEADRDDAETQRENAERRQESIADTVKSLQNDVAIHLATIETLKKRLTESLTVSSSQGSRPGSMASSSALGLGEDAAVRKLEVELSRYRALVRENEKEIKRLNDDLESLANEFSNAATAFEDAEEEMKAKISELEQFLEEKNLVRLKNDGVNTSSVSIASSLASSYTAKNREGTLLPPSSSSTSLSNGKSLQHQQQQLQVLKNERDQALQSSEELSLIVAELNEKNHSLQERLLNLEREHESAKLQHMLERQAQQDELRSLKDRAERLDRSSPSLAMLASANRDGGGGDDERASSVYERILRHKSSTSSDHFGGLNNSYNNAQGRGEDSLATPRVSWSTSSASMASQPNSQIRAGRHESTLIQQAKQIKLLEERIAELQQQGGNHHHQQHHASSPSSSPVIGLGIQHRSSDPDLARSSTGSQHMLSRNNSEKMSPALRALATIPAGMSTTPTSPPPTAPLPTPPVMMARTAGHAHLNGSAPSSPKMNGAVSSFDSTSMSSTSSPHSRPSRTSSIGKCTSISGPSGLISSSNSLRRAVAASSASATASAGSAEDRDTDLQSTLSDTTNSQTDSVVPTTQISPATAQALQGVEVNELRGVVDTLAHQVQALKVEQTMQQGKVTRLEASLAETEAKLREARTDRDQLLAERTQLKQELEKVRNDWEAAKQKSERDRAGLEGILEKERREREKAVETRAIMEQRMEELLSKKTKPSAPVVVVSGEDGGGGGGGGGSDKVKECFNGEHQDDDHDDYDDVDRMWNWGFEDGRRCPRCLELEVGDFELVKSKQKVELSPPTIEFMISWLRHDDRRMDGPITIS